MKFWDFDFYFHLLEAGNGDDAAVFIDLCAFFDAVIISATAGGVEGDAVYWGVEFGVL